jgi:hypothetical protein
MIIDYSYGICNKKISKINIAMRAMIVEIRNYLYILTTTKIIKIIGIIKILHRCS